MYDDFSEVIEERKKKEIKYETTFIGIKSSKIFTEPPSKLVLDCSP